MRRLASLVLLVPLLILGCTKTQISVRHSAPTRHYRLERIADSSVVRVENLSRVEGSLRGNLARSLSCQQIPIDVARTQTVEVTRSDPGKNGLLLASGAALTAVSVFALAAAGGWTESGFCDVNNYEDSGGQPRETTTCDSPRSTARFLATGGIVAGGATMVAATVGLLRRPSTKVLSDSASSKSAGEPQGPGSPCIDAEALSGIELALERDGVAIGKSTVDASGAFAFPLTEKYEDSLNIVVVSVPKHLQTLLPVGQVVAQYRDRSHETPPLTSPSASPAE